MFFRLTNLHYIRYSVHDFGAKINITRYNTLVMILVFSVIQPERMYLNFQIIMKFLCKNVFQRPTNLHYITYSVRDFRAKINITRYNTLMIILVFSVIQPERMCLDF